jgi:ABC-2 type transport system permease protein
MFYLIFGKQKATGYDVSFAAFYMVGMAAFGAFSGAFNNNTIRISQERKDGWIRQLRLTPLPANSYVVAKILASMVTTVPSIVIVFLLGRFYGDVQMPIWKWIVCALAIWIGTLIFAALAVALGYKLDPDSVQPVTIVVFFAFSIFGGLWFPLTGALQKFGEFTPTYQVVKITTDVIGTGTVALANVIGIAAWFAIFVTLATWAVRSTAETV